ncbi:MAG: acyltransferase family protein [Gammaproteobacteria bacterium]|nr:acyltransferase family protein [Gammaproteobacteria bacterium]
MTAIADQPKGAWQWVLIAKGIGILLVVIGHFNPDFAPAWWHELVTLIYTFHMPLFMILSGYLYVVGRQQWSELVASKFKRLGFPFIFIALLFLLIKLLSQLVVTLEHPISMNSLVTLLVNPGKSYMPLLWFMHALFFMFALYPILHRMLRHHAIILLVFVLLALWGPSPYPGINTIVHHFPFFVAGVWLRESGQVQLVQNKGWMRIALVSGLAFVASYWLAPKLDSGYPAHYLWLFPLGLLGSISVIAISHRLDLISKVNGSGSVVVNALASAGLYSMSIYLFHTLFESAVRVAAFQVLGLPVSWFLIVGFVAITVGMLMPLLLEKYVLRNVQLTRRYLLGLN